MKNARFLTFLFFLLSSGYPLFAGMNFDPDKYRHFVTAIDGDSFTLSNHTRWFANQNLLTGTEPLQAGTEVFMVSNMSKTDFGSFLVIYGVRGSGTCLLDPTTEKFFPTFKAMHNICVQEPGWFTAGKYLNVIELSDGSKWTCLSATLFCSKWTSDSPIFVMALPDSDFKWWFLWNLQESGLGIFEPCKPFLY